MPKHLALSTDLVNVVLPYLGTRPFQEVHQIIAGIQAKAAPQMQEQQEPMEVGGTD